MLAIALILATALVLRTTNLNPAIAQSRTIIAWEAGQSPGLDPAAPLWGQIAAVPVRLTAQTVAVPSGGGSVPNVLVRAAHHEGMLYMNVEWIDRTPDDSSQATEAFVDAAAIQIPALAGSSVPAVCMGAADGAVNIWQWRADGQTELDPLGKGSDFVDLYPSIDDLFYPARAAGNPLALPGAKAVHNLVAGGFGTLEPAAVDTVVGQGEYGGEQWRVVFARSLSAPDEQQPSFEEGNQFDVAFAVWDGHRSDRDGQKSVSEFVRLKVVDQAPPVFTEPPSGGTPSVAIWLAIGMIGLLAVVAAGLMIGQLARRTVDEQ
jgi:hypothetical protein